MKRRPTEAQLKILRRMAAGEVFHRLRAENAKLKAEVERLTQTLRAERVSYLGLEGDFKKVTAEVERLRKVAATAHVVVEEVRHRGQSWTRLAGMLEAYDAAREAK